MRIGLVGYGKMGKAIEEIAIERGHDIVFTTNSTHPLTPEMLQNADVVIEFTAPHLVMANLELILNANIPAVVGTTGWNEKLSQVEQKVAATDGALIHASNFSIGVNALFQINELLAKLLAKNTDYQVKIDEIHHVQKLDAPSGTAITLANGILMNNANYTSWICGEGKEPETQDHQLSVTAYREPNVPGTHNIQYESDVDVLKITHEAKSRKGFALGAVIAAEWIINKKGVFTMKDVLQ